MSNAKMKPVNYGGAQHGRREWRLPLGSAMMFPAAVNDTDAVNYAQVKRGVRRANTIPTQKMGEMNSKRYRGVEEQDERRYQLQRWRWPVPQTTPRAPT